MTETIYLQRLREVIQNLTALRNKLNAKIEIKNRFATIEGSSVDEYEATQVLEAINFGFSAKEALHLTSEDFQFITLKIKSLTRRKLIDVKARLIGKEGKTRRTMENVSGCAIVINENENAVGILGPNENVDTAIQAITSLIRGSKEANVYAYLERMNRKRREKSDLGLKPIKTKKE